MAIIDQIMTLPELADQPPVLVDIGAAARLNAAWKPFAKHSICIAFDADQREMGYIEKQHSGYRKLYVHNAIVCDHDEPNLDFHLTYSPQCSSILKPDTDNLADWWCADLFKVKNTVTLNAVTLDAVLQKLNLPKIDWFKADSQGTDLRLFASLGEQRIKQTLAAEFEPGIVDCYQNEDKFHSVIAAMDKWGFMMSHLNVRGPQRISPNLANRYFGSVWRKLIGGLLRPSPGWVAVTYLNRLKNHASLPKRELLLAWVFATVQKQHGIALEIAANSKQRFNDEIFDRMARHSVMRIKSAILRTPPFIARQIARSIYKSFTSSS